MTINIFCGRELGPKQRMQVYFGVGLVIYFAAVGFLSNIIAWGRYHNERDEGLVYDTVPWQLILYHWMTYVGGIMVGIGLIMAWPHSAFLWLVIFGGGIMFTGWVLYMIDFYGGAWARTYTLMSIDDFRKMNEFGLAANASYELYVSGRKSVGKKGKDCYTQSTFLPCIVNERSEEMISLTKDNIGDRAYRVRTTLNMVTDEQDTAFIEEFKRNFTTCVDSLPGIHSPVAHAIGYIEDYNREVLVTKDGTKPSAWNKAAGGVAGVFAFGIVYEYCMIWHVGCRSSRTQ